MLDVDLVRSRLRDYGARGTFQSFAELPTRRGKATFKFRWLLGAEFTLQADPGKGELVMRKLLPSIPSRSFLDRDLRRFVKGRSAVDLPEHRRLDPDLATLTYENRKGDVSLRCRLETTSTGPVLKSLLGVANDLFTHLHLYHIDYLHQNFGLPEE